VTELLQNAVMLHYDLTQNSQPKTYQFLFLYITHTVLRSTSILDSW